MATLKLLEKLTTTAGVPGREHRVRKLILNEIKEIFDEISIDPLGSIVAVKKAHPKRAAPAKNRQRSCSPRIWTRSVFSYTISTTRVFSI